MVQGSNPCGATKAPDPQIRSLMLQAGRTAFAFDSKSTAERLGGSTPFTGTIHDGAAFRGRVRLFCHFFLVGKALAGWLLPPVQARESNEVFWWREGSRLSGTPRTNPCERHYRTGLLSRIRSAKRCSGQGWRMRALGSQAFTRIVIRSQSRLDFWLRRFRVRYQSRATWVRKAPMASQFPGMAWYWNYP